jgi:acetolactate decarboxylase
MNRKCDMRRGAARVVTVVAATILAVGCRTVPLDTITQISSIRVLENGDLGGVMDCGELRRYGDFGYGIGEELAGQYILLDGTLHHVGRDGRLGDPQNGARMAFAVGSRFQWDQVVTIRERMDRKKVEALVTDAAGGEEALCAFKLCGLFLEVRVFTLEPAADDDAGYTEVAGKRPVISHKDIAGTAIGVSVPDSHPFFSDAGCRLFFVSDNLEFGGEIVDFTLQQGVVEIDACKRLEGVTGCLQGAGRTGRVEDGPPGLLNQ